MVTLNATKALDTYWQEFHKKGRIGPKPVSTNTVFGVSPFAGPVSGLIPPPQQALELVMSGQAANVLHMFTVAAEMTMPYFQTCFNPQLSTIYWKFLTRPVHVDLTEGFDDPSWRQEKSEARKRLEQGHGPSGSFAISRAKSASDALAYYALAETRPVYTDLSRTTPATDSSREIHTPNPFLFEPIFAPDEHGLFQAPTGRRFDAMTDFLFLKSPHVEDIMSLLEYGVAFLRGSSLLNWNEVNTLISFNVERIIHSLLYRFHQELDLNLVDRLVNCISIFALHREFTGQFHTIAPYMITAFNLAVSHNLHTIDPGNISRLILTVLYYTESPKVRDELEKRILTLFEHLPGILFRERFSYVSGALLTPEYEPETRDPAFWKKIESYLIEAEYILPHLDTAADLPPPCTVLFKCLFATMRAELGPRIGHHDWPVQQACLMANYLCSLGDHNTFIAVGLLVRFRIHSRRSSTPFNHHGRTLLVSDYLADQIQNIPTMPVVPIIPGEEPFLMDTAKLLEAELPSIPNEPSPPSPHRTSNSSNTLNASNSTNSTNAASFSSNKIRSSNNASPLLPQNGIPSQPSPESPDTSTSLESSTSARDDTTRDDSARSGDDSSLHPHSSPSPNNTVIIDNSSPFLKDTGTPDAPVVKKGTSYSKSIIGY